MAYPSLDTWPRARLPRRKFHFANIVDPAGFHFDNIIDPEGHTWPLLQELARFPAPVPGPPPQATVNEGESTFLPTSENPTGVFVYGTPPTTPHPIRIRHPLRVNAGGGVGGTALHRGPLPSSPSPRTARLIIPARPRTPQQEGEGREGGEAADESVQEEGGVADESVEEEGEITDESVQKKVEPRRYNLRKKPGRHIVITAVMNKTPVASGSASRKRKRKQPPTKDTDTEETDREKPPVASGSAPRKRKRTQPPTKDTDAEETDQEKSDERTPKWAEKIRSSAVASTLKNLERLASHIKDLKDKTKVEDSLVVLPDDLAPRTANPRLHLGDFVEVNYLFPSSVEPLSYIFPFRRIASLILPNPPFITLTAKKWVGTFSQT